MLNIILYTRSTTTPRFSNPKQMFRPVSRKDYCKIGGRADKVATNLSISFLFTLPKFHFGDQACFDPLQSIRPPTVGRESTGSTLDLLFKNAQYSSKLISSSLENKAAFKILQYPSGAGN